jgi:hypothetical protein
LRARARQRFSGQDRRLPRLYGLESELFFTNRVAVSIDPTDHIESLNLATEGSLMFGTDYSHTDISGKLSAPTKSGVGPDEGYQQYKADKILEKNSRAFYGL